MKRQARDTIIARLEHSFETATRSTLDIAANHDIAAMILQSLGD